MSMQLQGGGKLSPVQLEGIICSLYSLKLVNLHWQVTNWKIGNLTELDFASAAGTNSVGDLL